jgi:hypothetical protein
MGPNLLPIPSIEQIARAKNATHLFGTKNKIASIHLIG